MALLRHTPIHEALTPIVERYYVGAVREERDSEEVKSSSHEVLLTRFDSVTYTCDNTRSTVYQPLLSLSPDIPLSESIHTLRCSSINQEQHNLVKRWISNTPTKEGRRPFTLIHNCQRRSTTT